MRRPRGARPPPPSAAPRSRACRPVSPEQDAARIARQRGEGDRDQQHPDTERPGEPGIGQRAGDGQLAGEHRERRQPEQHHHADGKRPTDQPGTPQTAVMSAIAVESCAACN